MIQTEGIFVGGSAISAPIIGEDFNWSGGDGTYQVLDDGGGNWRIKFLSSGTFMPLKDMVIDVFLVGAGGGKGSVRCGGGGAGYTTTVRSITLAANTAYADIAVTAAQQIYTPEEWDVKKKYVQDFLTSKGYDVNLTEVDAAIEAAVKRVKKELGA